MADDILTTVLRVSGVADYKNAMKGASDAVQQVAEAEKRRAEQLRNAGLAATAYGAAVLGMAGMAVKAANEQAAAEAKLTSAMRARGIATGEAGLIKQAADLQKVTAYSDEATLAMQAQLIAMGMSVDEVRRGTPIFQDLGTVFESMEGAADAVGRAMTTHMYRGLRQFGIQIDAAEGSTLTFNELLGMLDKRAHGAAAATEAAQGGVNALKHQFDECLESLGRGLLPAIKSAVPILVTLGTIFQHIAESGVGKVVIVVGALTGVLAALAGPLLGIIGQIKLWSIAANMAKLATGGLAAAQGGAAVSTGILAGAMVRLRAASAFLMSPTGLLVMGIAAVAGVAYEAYKNIELMRESSQALMRGLAESRSMMMGARAQQGFGAPTPISGRIAATQQSLEAAREARDKLGGAGRNFLAWAGGYSDERRRLVEDANARVEYYQTRLKNLQNTALGGGGTYAAPSDIAPPEDPAVAGLRAELQAANQHLADMATPVAEGVQQGMYDYAGSPADAKADLSGLWSQLGRRIIGGGSEYERSFSPMALQGATGVLTGFGPGKKSTEVVIKLDKGLKAEIVREAADVSIRAVTSALQGG